MADGKLVAIVEFKISKWDRSAITSTTAPRKRWATPRISGRPTRKAQFRPSERPWLGYLMLLEDAPAANSPVRVKDPHFQVFPEFRDASYARRTIYF